MPAWTRARAESRAERRMVEGSWWSAAVGVGLGLLGLTGSATLLRRRGRNRGTSITGGSEDRWRRRGTGGRYGTAATEAEEGQEPQDGFVCKRVCTSERMLKRVGSFAKDVTPNSCVTVCGVSDVDACADACARAVCANPHHVPNWNDVCMRRCQSECLRLSSR